MNDLPPGWKIVRLEEVADTALGKMLDRSKSKRHPAVPYLRNVNVQWGRIDTDDLLTMEIPPEQVERFTVRQGDLLVCEGGEIGRAAIWNRPDTIAYQKALHRVRSKGQLVLAYLRYLLEFYSNSGLLARFATGSTIAHLPQEQLRALPVPLPPVEEQRRIVDIIEDHLSRLDAGAKLVNAAIRRLAAMERSVLARVAQTDALPQPLSDVAEIQGGIQKQPKRKPASNAYPFLRVANVTANGLDLTDVHQIELFGNELDRLRLERGDLLVVEGNGSPSQIGRAALWDGSIPNCVHQNHLIRVRPKKNLLPEFLEAVWNSPRNREELTRVASSTSGLYTLSVSKISNLPIPLPPLEEQRRRVAHVARVRDDRQRLEVEARAVLARSARLRRAVLAAAFSGQLTERTQVDVEELIGG